MIEIDFKPTVEELEKEDVNKYIEHLAILSACSWDSIIRKQEILTWLSNFNGSALHSEKAEQILALYLAINFVYYTENDVRSMSQNLWWKYCHYLINENVEEGWKDKTISEKMSYIINCSSINPLGNSAGSGTNICYYFRQANNMDDTAFQAYSPEKHKYFCVIDDSSLSGNSVIEALKSHANLTPDTKLFLLTFITSNEALELIKREYPDLQVISTLVLDNKSKLFSDDSLFFYCKDDWKAAAKQLSKYYGKKLFNHNPLGYHKGQYAIGFFYNTPNNSLPIFWSEAFGWKPLFKRYFTTKVEDGVTDDEFFY